MVLSSAGFGDPQVLEYLQPHLQALLLLIGPAPGPLTEALLSTDCHIEVLIGIDKDIPQLLLPWQHISAVHIGSLRSAAAPQQRSEWYRQLRQQIPETVPLYDEDHQHSVCACGEVLIWRQAGRSRLDALDAELAHCRYCQRPMRIVM
jgi:hypothetical protein